MNNEIRFEKNVKTLRHGNTHTEYRDDRRGLLIQEEGIAWAIYRNNQYVAAHGRLRDALNAARMFV
jgi:hypothetical protein